jgi:hypothetical protein
MRRTKKTAFAPPGRRKGTPPIPGGVAFPRSGSLVWVSTTDGVLSALDRVSGRRRAKIALKPGVGAALAISPDGTRAAVGANRGSRAAAIVNLGTRQLAARVRTGAGPGAPAFATEGPRLYIGDGGGDTVSIFSTLSLRRLGTQRLGRGTHPRALAVQPGLAVKLGTEGPDQITGTRGRDRLEGLGGDDVLRGGRADDSLLGGLGNDDLGGGASNDLLDGGDGSDRLAGQAGNDTLLGAPGNDTLYGGTGNDTLDGGLGIDSISGSAGNDSLVGPSNDGSQDTLDGGLNTDACQGPAPDPDIHASCENTTPVPTTGPGASLGDELCISSGGLFVDLSPVAYNCVFLKLKTDQRRPEARRICNQGGGSFLDVRPLEYSCVLP